MTYKVVKRGSLLMHLTTAESCTMCNDVGAESCGHACVNIAEAKQSCALCNDVGAESCGHACVDIAEANQSCALRNDDFLVDSRK